MGKSTMKPDAGAAEASQARHGRAPPDTEENHLLDAIEAQIIPRLLLAHRGDAEAGCGDQRMPPTDDEIETVARLAVREEVHDLVKRLSAMASEGLSFDSILLQLIAPAANWLGDAWNDDQLTFSEVTVGAGVLERVAAALGQDSDPPLRHGELIVLTAAPGEQHVIPIHLLGEVLRHKGWAVHVDPNLSDDELLELVRDDHIAVVGIACKDVTRMEGVGETIATVRAQSLNPDISFVIGGTGELALRAPRFGATYCHEMDDFIEFVGRPEPRDSRESSVLPAPIPMIGADAADEDAD